MSNQVLDASAIIDHIRELADIPLITPQANSQTSEVTDTFVSPSLTSVSDNQGQAHVPQSASTPSVAQREDSNQQGSRYPSRIPHPPDVTFSVMYAFLIQHTCKCASY